jgi:hypothetical protein
MGRLVVALFAAAATWGAEETGTCDGGGYGALSFWVGNWKVSDPAGNELGSSQIELGLDGCELTETWAAGGKFRGSNTHAYSAEDKRWHQLNVDNHGHVHAFEGTAGDRGLEYSGMSRNESGGDVLNRMEIVKDGANRVKVWWRKSTDAGKTWTTSYEAVYHRTDHTN